MLFRIERGSAAWAELVAAVNSDDDDPTRVLSVSVEERRGEVSFCVKHDEGVWSPPLSGVRARRPFRQPLA